MQCIRIPHLSQAGGLPYICNLGFRIFYGYAGSVNASNDRLDEYMPDQKCVYEWLEYNEVEVFQMKAPLQTFNQFILKIWIKRLRCIG